MCQADTHLGGGTSRWRRKRALGTLEMEPLWHRISKTQQGALEFGPIGGTARGVASSHAPLAMKKPRPVLSDGC